MERYESKAPTEARFQTVRKYQIDVGRAIGWRIGRRFGRPIGGVLLAIIVIAASCGKKPSSKESSSTEKTEQNGRSSQSAERQESPGSDNTGASPETSAKVAKPNYSPQQVSEILQLRDRALARLEAGPIRVEWKGETLSSIELAARHFNRLQELAPHERLPFQNYTISQVFALVSADREQTESFRGPADVATRAFLKRYPHSADAVFLRVTAITYNVSGLQKRRVSPEVVNLLQQAAKRNPKDVRLWFALYEFATTSRDAATKKLAGDALKQAIHTAPNNVTLLREWLQYLAREKPPELVEEFQRARAVLGPIAMRVKNNLSQSLDTYFDAAVKNPSRALSPAIRIANLINPDEIQRRDLAGIRPHPMDLVVYEFTDPALQTPPRELAAKDTKLAFDREALPVDVGAEVRQLLVADFDQDGWLDVWLLEDNKLTIRGGDLDPEKWKTLVKVDVPAGAKGVLAADLDRDKNFDVQVNVSGKTSLAHPRGVACVESDVDVVIYGDFGCRVYRNDLQEDGSRQLVLQEQELGLENLRNVDEAIFADLDMDYDLDLVTSSAEGTSLWLSMGAWRFAKYDQFSQLPSGGKPLRSMMAVDLDRDADIDIVAVDADGKVGYLENMLHVRFRWGALGTGFPECSDARAVRVIESDGNASWDIVVTRKEQTELWRTVTTEDTYRFVARAEAKGTADRLRTGDFNNDGLEDLVLWGSRPLGTLQGRGPGGFSPWEKAVLEEPVSVEAVEVDDFDADGDLDILYVSQGEVILLRNSNPSGNRWLMVHLRGLDDNAARCNRNGLGSMIELKSKRGYQARVVDRPTAVHFGLGDEAQVDVMRIVWTNGMPQAEVDVSGNILVCEPMRLPGSCPFLYTWDGAEFAFLTDCLWGAPLGLQVEDGVVVPTREWEYLRIPGKNLQPKGGAYELMLTEELWEAVYFDHVELLAVDHPPDVEIYSNEKVGPAEIAEFKIHTVKRKRYPVSAVDSQGRDCAELLRSQDGNFVQAFPRAIKRGLAPRHYIELDLGDLPDDPRVVLFLTGWIFPTDTSLNIAYAQDPDIDGPVLPYVQMLDERGAWQTVIPYMGFPGGKTKTIAVDLTGHFPSKQYKLRIVTSAEIYWDRAFFTLNEEPAELRVTRLPVTEAKLAYRGFSASMPYRRDAPRMFDGRRVSRDPQWVPMHGPFTRYGDVIELLRRADDQMVVMGSGDAMVCRFDYQPVPEGMTRDFLLYSVGWDKDANLNTQYGQHSLPLPYRGMKAYPAGLLDAPEETRKQRATRGKYLTRRQNWNEFWKALVPRPLPNDTP